MGGYTYSDIIDDALDIYLLGLNTHGKILFIHG